MQISHKTLTADALTAVLDEFITRDGVVWDGSLQQKRQRVLRALDRKHAVIVYDDTSKSTTILTAEEYAQRIAQSNE